MTENDKYVIWWQSQDAAIEIDCILNDLDLPEYIKLECRSRFGRTGRGRLWVPAHIPLTGIEWTDERPVCQVAGHCGGIVIDINDAKLVAYLPGFVTRLNMELFRSE